MSHGPSGQAILEAQPDLTIEQLRERMAKHRARVDELLRRYPVKRGALLPALWLVQEEFGWVPRIGIRWAAEICEVSPVHAYSVAEFYTMYKKAPTGRYLIQVCQTMCCQLEGADALIAHIGQRLGIHAGETSADGLFTLVRVECLAACGNAPAILINDEFLYGPGELNEHVEGWHPSAADVDRWLERLKREAAAKPEPMPPVDALGGIKLETRGHPGACGATAQVLPPGYAAAPPALKLKAESKGSAITLGCMCAPEATAALVERSDDGVTWRGLGSVDVTKAPGIPGPPGGPKQVTFTDELGIGATAHYRVIAREGERTARPSAVATVTATEPAPAPVAGGQP